MAVVRRAGSEVRQVSVAELEPSEWAVSRHRELGAWEVFSEVGLTRGREAGPPEPAEPVWLTAAAVHACITTSPSP